MQKPFKNGNIPWNKGKKGVQIAWNKGRKMSQEDWIDRKFNKRGIKLSEDHKRLLGNILREVGKNTRFKKGQIISDEMREKLRKNSAHNKYWLGKNNPYMEGEKNWQWKGGVTPENNKVRHTVEYKEWRRMVFKRDYFACRVCRSKKCLNAHHIQPFRDNLDKRTEMSNGITLCLDCHKIMYKREHLFIKTLQGILENGFNSVEASKKEVIPSQQERLRKALWACVTVKGE